jgi:hypothetical protein
MKEMLLDLTWKNWLLDLKLILILRWASIFSKHLVREWVKLVILETQVWMSLMNLDQSFLVRSKINNKHFDDILLLIKNI